MCKRNQRVRISSLTKSEYDVILREANFTEEQRKLFVELNRDNYYDFAIMLMLNLGSNTRKYYDLKSVVIDKVERIAQEYGFYESIKHR